MAVSQLSARSQDLPGATRRGSAPSEGQADGAKAVKVTFLPGKRQVLCTYNAVKQHRLHREAQGRLSSWLLIKANELMHMLG